MDTSDPEIIFDGQGFCNHCTVFLHKRANHNYQGDESDKTFASIVENIKREGQDKKYDAIVGISGGADSCYTAYIAQQKGLRVLAVHMDNGWDSEEAVQNLKNVAQKLKIDYESFVLNWDEFREIQLAFLKASVPEADTPTDVAIPAALHYYAAKFGVKYILSGGNFSTEGILPPCWHYNAKDLKYFNHILKTFGRKKIKTFPTFGVKKEMYYKLLKRIKIIYPLNYVPYVKDDVVNFLKENLNWKFYGGKHHESRYTRFIQSYYLFEKFGIDYRRATFSTQICTGEIGRDEALEALKVKPYDSQIIENDKTYIAKKFQISNEEFEAILNLPPKWYWEYPNDSKKLGFVYDAYRKIYNKEKLGSF